MVKMTGIKPNETKRNEKALLCVRLAAFAFIIFIPPSHGDVCPAGSGNCVPDMCYIDGVCTAAKSGDDCSDGSVPQRLCSLDCSECLVSFPPSRYPTFTPSQSPTTLPPSAAPTSWVTSNAWVWFSTGLPDPHVCHVVPSNPHSSPPLHSSPWHHPRALTD